MIIYSGTKEKLNSDIAAGTLAHKISDEFVARLHYSTGAAEYRSWENSLREMITHQTEKYAWEFNFLAANIDAKEIAVSMGIDSERATQFDANVDGLHACFCAMRKMTATTRKPTKCI